jgi:sugar/nucleoside kinase (ribokinase family)
MIVVVGDLVTDVLVVHDGPVQPGSDTAATITVSGGGQAANTAAWLRYAGAPVTLVAAVGDDAAGRDRIAELTRAGVRCAVGVHPGVATGSIVVLASADERTMLTDRGAAVRLDPAGVTAAVRDAPGAVHLHLSGYALLDARSRPGGLAALAAACDRGLTTSVDAASAAPLRQAGGFADWVRGTDLLLCNADEAVVLAGPGRAEEQAAALTAVARHVVVKRGGDGAVWAGRDGVVRSVAGERVPVKDPTGAGDAFAAGLLRAWCAGAAPEEALAAGATLGAAAVGRIGARPDASL